MQYQQNLLFGAACSYGSVTRRKGKIFSGSEHYFIRKSRGTEVRSLFQFGLLYPWGKSPGLPWIRDRLGLTVCLSVGVCYVAFVNNESAGLYTILTRDST